MAFTTMLLMLTVGVVLSIAQKQTPVTTDDCSHLTEADDWYSDSNSVTNEQLRRHYLKHKVS